MVHDFTRAHTPGFSPSSEAVGDDSRSGCVGRHTCMWQSCRDGARPACAPCLRGSACPRPPEPPRGHMCAHACAARRVGAQEMHPNEVDVPHALWLDYFRCPSSCISPPAPALWVYAVRGEGGSSGHPLAAPTPASPRSMQATIHPFIYSNINIFAFRLQPKRDKAFPRGLSNSSSFDKAANATRLVGNGSGCLCAS